MNDKNSDSSAHPSHLQAVRDLFAPAHWAASVALTPVPHWRISVIAGMQAALSALCAIVLLYLSAWPQLVAYAALGALGAVFGRFAPVERRMRIVAICSLLMMLGVLLPSLASWAGASSWGMVLVLALVAGGSMIAVSQWRLGGPGAVIVVFVAGASLAPVDGGLAVLQRTLATVVGGLVASLVCLLTDHLRRSELASLSLPLAPTPPMGHQLLAAGRVAVGAACAALIAHGAGWHHPAWAAIGATAVMQGGHLHLTMIRSLQRMAGTVVGSLLVWAILEQQPSFWTIVLTVVAFQFITEVVIAYNYALGQITVTPMALLMTHLAAPVGSAQMPVERVFDTILGAVIGIVFALLLSRVDDRAYLLAHRQQGEAGKP